MALHLQEISQAVAPGAHAVVLLDQAGWHTSVKLKVPANISLLPLPPKSPELNPQENVWQYLRGNWLSNRIFASGRDIVDHCCDAWNNLSEILDLGYLAQVLSRPGAFPGPEKQKLLYDSVVNACDDQDGVADKVISNPAGCHFDPRVLRCPGGADAGPACLSDPQIGAVTAMSSPFRWPYRIASGETGYPGFPFLAGADMRRCFIKPVSSPQKKKPASNRTPMCAPFRVAECRPAF